MAEALSQSQIDDLLKAALGSGGDEQNDAPSPEPIQERPKYRKYDFYSPRKFTKDRLRILSGIFENYSRVVNSKINGMLHTSCEITVDSVEEQRYYEFSNAISENDVLTLVETQIYGNKDPEDLPVVYHYSTPLMLSMIDRLMGGVGDMDLSLTDGYIFTDIELKLYESLAHDFINVLSDSWENYINIDFDFQKIETNPTLVQVIGLDETVVIVSLNIKFENCSGTVSICLPGMTLTNVFTEMAANNRSIRSTGEDNSTEIMDIIKGSDLEIKAELSRTSISLSDVNTLNVGDVINLNHLCADPVMLLIGDKPWFNGKIGVKNNNIAVKIYNTYHEYAGEREEE